MDESAQKFTECSINIFIIYNFLQVDMKSFFSLLHLMEILVRSWSVVEIKLRKMIWICASHKL